MSSLLAIDSGYPECACAVTNSKGLIVYARMLPVDEAPSEDKAYADRVVVEIPQGDGRSVPTDDLIKIAVAGMRLATWCAGRSGTIVEYRPREWKGSTPKPPHHARMWAALDAKERALLGGERTHAAILLACKRGAQGAWKKPGATYYRAKEFPTVNGTKITHDILDAVALALYDLKRIPKG
jgi:hypothetical protein